MVPNPYQSPTELGHEREGWIRANLHLALTWLWTSLLSLLAVLFMLIIVGHFAEELANRPLRTAVKLFGGMVLGCGLLWTNYMVLQRARRKYRESIELRQCDRG